MEHIFGMRRSKLSAIIQIFSSALYHVSLPYLSDQSIRHQRMLYYAQLIKNKTGHVIDSCGDSLMARYKKLLILYRIKNGL